VAVSCESWDVANELVFNIYEKVYESGIDDVELELRDAGMSLARFPWQDSASMPRRLKKVCVRGHAQIISPNLTSESQYAHARTKSLPFAHLSL
jgi:hypothetical protein